MSTPEGRRLTDEHRRQQVALSGDSAAEAALLWAQRGRMSDTDWLAAQVGLLRLRDEQAATLALAYLRLYRQAEVGTDRMPEAGLDGFDTTRVAASVWSNGPALYGRLIGEGVDPAEASRRAQAQVAATAQRHTLTGGRRVVDESTLANPHSTGWRRVSDGNPCSWCAMLAGRGPAYRSEQSAGAGRRFHNRCGCTVEEVFGDWEPTAAEERWSDAYDRAHEPGMSPEETAARMRAAGGFSDSPAPTSLRSTTAAPQISHLDWQRRQASLGIETYGDQLEPHEIEFVERFLARGERIEWIPKLRSTPTNDFIWLSNQALPTEVKSTRARYTTIRGRVEDAVSRAGRQGVVKENIIVDLGREELTDDLRDELAGFNRGRRKHRIARMWVLHRDGRSFDEIPLET